MNDLAAAAGPFAGAARLLEKLAGVRLTARRVERGAEASGIALAAAGRERARLIASRKVVPLPPSPLPDKLYAAIDGTGVPMTARPPGQSAGRSRPPSACTPAMCPARSRARPARARDHGWPTRRAWSWCPGWPGYGRRRRCSMRCCGAAGLSRSRGG
jgi:hypothetical protein